jgi:hypothetical protein
MERNDSQYWSLFENRPAKERTSADVSERSDIDFARSGKRVPAPQTGAAERIKC